MSHHELGKKLYTMQEQSFCKKNLNKQDYCEGKRDTSASFH